MAAMDTQPLRDLVASPVYLDVLDRLRGLVSLSLDRTVPEGAWLLDAKRIDAADVPFERLTELLGTDRERFAWFVALKLKKYAGAVIDDGNPYGLSLEGSPRLSYYGDVLLGHLIEYALLTDAPDELEDYLKGIRVPGAKKYGRELATIVERADARLVPALG